MKKEYYIIIKENLKENEIEKFTDLVEEYIQDNWNLYGDTRIEITYDDFNNKHYTFIQPVIYTGEE